MTNKTRFCQIMKLEKLMWIAMQGNLEAMKNKEKEADKKSLFYKAIRECSLVNKSRAVLCLELDNLVFTDGVYYHK